MQIARAQKNMKKYPNDDGVEVITECPECGELNKSMSEECENCGCDLTA